MRCARSQLEWSVAGAIQVRWSRLAYRYNRYDDGLRKAVAACEKESDEEKNKGLKGWTLDCDPDSFGDPKGNVGNQRDIAVFAQAGGKLNRATFDETALWALAIGCVALVWYFLLDRIREISAAVSGRDRTP